MKYRIQREGLSMTITAQSREEAEGDFCARLAQKVKGMKGQRVEKLKGEGFKRVRGKRVKGRKPSTRGGKGHGR